MGVGGGGGDVGVLTYLYAITILMLTVSKGEVDVVQYNSTAELSVSLTVISDS